MTQTPDAHTIALLETQCSELTSILMRLESTRRELEPDHATPTWRGATRHAYDAAIESLLMTVGAGCAALRAARDHTRVAITELMARG